MKKNIYASIIGQTVMTIFLIIFMLLKQPIPDWVMAGYGFFMFLAFLYIGLEIRKNEKNRKK